MPQPEPNEIERLKEEAHSRECESAAIAILNERTKMPRPRKHPDDASRSLAHAAARKGAGMVRKSIDLTAEEQATLDALRAAWDLDSDRAVMRRLIADAAKKIAKSQK